MTGNLLFASKDGCRIISSDFDFLIDPAAPVFNTPGAIFFSGPRTAGEGIKYIQNFKNTPVFTSIMTKKLINLNFIKHWCLTGGESISQYEPDEIIDCRLRTKKLLRKASNIVGEFAFYGYGELPGTSAVLLKSNEHSVLYVTGELPSGKNLPSHDTLLINVPKKLPLKSILEKVPEFSVKITDFSKLYDVLNFFNSGYRENLVAIDDSALSAACEYLKLDCTVFSKAVKPLSSFKALPPVIITTKPNLYKNRPVVECSVFLPAMQLSDIYSFASQTNSKQIIAVCPDFHGIRKRGNLTICQTNTLITL